MRSLGWPSFVVGAVFTALHLTFQVFVLMQSYLSGMAHFDDPLSRQAAWESQFWERMTTVGTFPLVHIWEHLPSPWRSYSAVEWGLLALNSLFWAAVLVTFLRWVGEYFSREESSESL